MSYAKCLDGLPRNGAVRCGAVRFGRITSSETRALCSYSALCVLCKSLFSYMPESNFADAGSVRFACSGRNGDGDGDGDNDGAGNVGPSIVLVSSAIVSLCIRYCYVSVRRLPSVVQSM